MFPLPSRGPGRPLVRRPCLSVSQLEERTTPTVTITEFSTPAGVVYSGVATGSDGNLWFNGSGNGILRMTPQGQQTVFSASDSSNTDIAAGPDGNMWFTTGGPAIGKITPQGQVTEFTTGITEPTGDIVAGPDGNVWFTESDGNGHDKIGCITPTGAVTEYSAGITAGSDPLGITAGPDGNLWFTEWLGNKVGRITPQGVVTEFDALVPALSGLGDIAAGPDGNLWYTTGGAGKIGRMTPQGQATLFDVGSNGNYKIAAGPDGNMWFTTTQNTIARLTPQGQVDTFGTADYTNFIAVGPDNAIWFTTIGQPGKIGRADIGLNNVPVSVSAQYDSLHDPAGKTFGTYISGVKLPDTFTVGTPAAGPLLGPGTADTVTKKFRFSIDGVPAATQTQARSAAGTSSFKFDVGSLPADPGGAERDYPFKVEALDGKGKTVGEFDGTIKVAGALALTSPTLKPALDGRAGRAVDDVRLLATDAEPDLEFAAGVTGAVPDFYQGKLGLTFFNHGTTTFDHKHGQVPIPPGGIANGNLTLAIPQPRLKDLNATDQNQPDYDLALAPLAKYQEGKAPAVLATAGGLKVVAPPAWLSGRDAKATFAADATTGAIFGIGAAGYEITTVLRKEYGLKLPRTTGAAFAALAELNGLKGLTNLPSHVDMRAGFTVVAPIFMDDPAPVVTADHMAVTATLLDESFKQVTLPPVPITASVDLLTLANPTSLKVDIPAAAPLDLIPILTNVLGKPPEIDHKFGPWRIDVPVFTTGLLNAKGFIDLKGRFQAKLTTLDVYGTMTFGFTNGKLDWGKSSGNFALDLAANATAHLTGGAGVSVEALGFKVDLVRLNASGDVNMSFAATAAAKFDPTGLTLDKPNTHGTMDVSWSNFQYNLDALKNDPGTDTETSNFDSTALSVWNP